MGNAPISAGVWADHCADSTVANSDTVSQLQSKLVTQKAIESKSDNSSDHCANGTAVNSDTVSQLQSKPTTLIGFKTDNSDDTQSKIGRRWINGRIAYKTEVKSKGLLKLIHAAIDEFHSKTTIKWIPALENDRNFVIFVENSEECPQSNVGMIGGAQHISLPYPHYPHTTYHLKKVCILHEMMHTLGFLHEHQRSDRDTHVYCNVDSIAQSEMDFAIDGVTFGSYDYQSIMHYGHGVGGMKCKNSELRSKADASLTFSQGDLSSIRRVYGNRTTHFGEWHKECTGTLCTDSGCGCGACGTLPGGVYCGYTGKKGHWTCCMSEDVMNLKCSTTHTGFWHMQCSGFFCTGKTCRCGACGNGCTYEGRDAHWSCCRSDKFSSKCVNNPYQK